MEIKYINYLVNPDDPFSPVSQYVEEDLHFTFSTQMYREANVYF